jgi:hypothetical protein
VTRATIVFSVLLIALGCAMLVRTLVGDAEGLAYGYLAGAAFIGAGAARLFLVTRSRA